MTRERNRLEPLGASGRVNLREILTEPREVSRWGVLGASLILPVLAVGIERLLVAG